MPLFAGAKPGILLISPTALSTSTARVSSKMSMNNLILCRIGHEFSVNVYRSAAYEQTVFIHTSREPQCTRIEMRHKGQTIKRTYYRSAHCIRWTQVQVLRENNSVEPFERDRPTPSVRPTVDQLWSEVCQGDFP